MKYQYYLQEPNFTVESIDIQNVSRPMGFKHSFRGGRGKHGFIYVVSGKICDSFLQSKKESIYIGAGELVFIPKNSNYVSTYLEKNTYIKIIQFDLAKGELPSYLSEPVKIGLPDAGKLVESFFEPVQNRISNHPFYYLSRLYELLWQIDENYMKTPAKYKRLAAALAEITEFFYKNESVAYYASLCDMSEVNFRRLFREYTGMSPIDYRNDLRLKNARSMLQSSEYNVTEAAVASGFSNLSFFIKLYKKKYGHTPKKE